ncbi:DUF7409 domain-containing protein [Halobellus captivus]|uniref:DUF7409 domain-containing protein n=1 Tax=Halobellus captivus TaxID=2592614 RepID=UPI001EF14302|nr:helix-hairpin-helix domain-containing protein [Halobellus captivus]
MTEDGDSERGRDGEGTGDRTDRGPTASEIDGPVRATSDDYVDLDIPLPWNVSSDDNAAATESENADRDADERKGSDGYPAEDAAKDAVEGPAEDVAAGGNSTEGDETDGPPAQFEDIRFVGPKSAAALRESEITLSGFVNKHVAYRDLTDAGVNPGVAAKIRREHSLSWSLDGGGTDLDRRSAQVRGLDDEERAWIAASSGWSTDDTAATETDGSGDAQAAEAAWRDRQTGEKQSEPSTMDAETAWRRRSAPTSVTALDGIDAETADTLRKAGIGSIRRLATADPESVADALEVDRDRVESWCRLAREHDASADDTAGL